MRVWGHLFVFVRLYLLEKVLLSLGITILIDVGWSIPLLKPAYRLNLFAFVPLISFTYTAEKAVLAVFRRLSEKSSRKKFTKNIFFNRHKSLIRASNSRIMILKAPKHFKSSKRHVIHWRVLHRSALNYVSGRAGCAILFAEGTNCYKLATRQLVGQHYIAPVYKVKLSTPLRLIFNGCSSILHTNC